MEKSKRPSGKKGKAKKAIKKAGKAKPALKAKTVKKATKAPDKLAVLGVEGPLGMPIVGVDVIK